MTAALMITIGFFNTPRIIGSIAASFIFLLSAFCRANRIKKFKQKNLDAPSGNLSSGCQGKRLGNI